MCMLVFFFFLPRRQGAQIVDVFTGYLLVVSGPRADAATQTTQGAAWCKKIKVSSQYPQLVHGEDEGILPFSAQDCPILIIDLLQLTEVSEQGVVHLPHDLPRLIVACALIRVKTTNIGGQGEVLEVGDIDALSHRIVLCANIQGSPIQRIGHGIVSHLIVFERSGVNLAILEGVLPCAILDIPIPIACVLGAVGIIECATAVANTIVPLPLVAIVHLLRRTIFDCLVRLRLWRKPRVRTDSLWMVIFPIPRVLLFNTHLKPGHGTLA
mmetsp:Transcript_143580/g.264714  ORF Transcript_143580/g.264714 Transcript_143580/m.264714 type:complete len:268 (-) Transcript_143580:648-1451(-)